METALNLSWMVITCLLCAACVLAGRCGRLRVRFAAALLCTLLLAALLFPAISMTDDLQCSNLQAEVGLRADAALLHTVAAEPAALGIVFAVLLLALAVMGVRLIARLATVQARCDHLPLRMHWYRPQAVRPPTLLAAL